MNRRIVVSAMVVLSSFLSVPASHAAMFGRADVQTVVKAHPIKFSVRNDTRETVVLQAGDQQISLAPGQTRNVALEDGLRLLSATASVGRPAGALVVQVGRMLQGNTVVLS